MLETPLIHNKRDALKASQHSLPLTGIPKLPFFFVPSFL